MSKVVRITDTIANEYMTRDVFPFAWEPGNVVLNDGEFNLLLEDAVYYSDRVDGPDIPHTLARSYSSLAKRLIAELREGEQ